MAKRKRKPIKLSAIAASALADKLPAAMRDAMRAEKRTDTFIIRLFTPDHIKLHAWGGSDEWWNLDMRLRGADLKLKDAADTSRAAKTVRVSERWRAFTRNMAKPGKRKPKSKWPSRPFPKRVKQ
jgi:hypothetical protein